MSNRLEFCARKAVRLCLRANTNWGLGRQEKLGNVKFSGCLLVGALPGFDHSSRRFNGRQIGQPYKTQRIMYAVSIACIEPTPKSRTDRSSDISRTGRTTQA